MDGSEIAVVKLECRNLGLKHSIKTKTPVVMMSDWYLPTSEKGYTDYPAHR